MNKFYYQISIAVFLTLSFLISFSILQFKNFTKTETLSKATAAFGEKTISGTENWQLGSTENMNLATDLKPMIDDLNQGKQEIPITHFTTSATTETLSKDNPITGGSWTVTPVLIQNPFPDYTFREEYWTVDLSEEQDYSYISFNLAADWAYHSASMLMISSDGSNWTYFHNDGACEDGSTYPTVLDMVNNCPVNIVYNYNNTPGAKYARIYMYDTTDVHSEYPTNHEDRTYSVSNFKIYKDGATATHTSSGTQMDGGDNFKKWTTFVPSDTIPANTSINYRFRTSADSSTWGSWTTSTASAASIDIETLLGDTDKTKRYLQVETELKNTDGASTPVLDAYTANYETGVLDHVDITATPEAVTASQISALSAQAISDIPKVMTPATFSWSTTCGTVVSTGDNTATFTAPTNISAPFPNVCTVSATTTIDGITKTGTKNISISPCFAIIYPPVDDVYHPWGFSTHYDALAVTNPLVWENIPGVTFNFSTDHGSVDNNGNYVAPSEDWTDPSSDPNSHTTATITLNSSCGGTASTQIFLGAAPETCGDGVQNNDETGPDCGGSCGVCPVPVPTCTDGKKNGIESGVDCGGICAACPTNPTDSGSPTNPPQPPAPPVPPTPPTPTVPSNPPCIGNNCQPYCQGNDCECLGDSCACTGPNCNCTSGDFCQTCVGDNCDPESCVGDSCTTCTGSNCKPDVCVGDNCQCLGDSCACTGPDCNCTSGDFCQTCVGDNCDPEPCTGDSCVPCEGSSCKPDVCTGDDCQCVGDSCACTGPECSCTSADFCQTCVGDNCDPEPCTGDSCVPCEGSGCKPDICTGDDCQCIGDSCACTGPECNCSDPEHCQTCVGDSCDPEPCVGDSCVPCEGSSCKPDVCTGDDCQCVGDSCACTGPDCSCTDPDKCKTCLGNNCEQCVGDSCIPCTSTWCKLPNLKEVTASILLPLAGILTLLSALLANLLSLLTTTPAWPLFALFLKGKSKKHQPGIVYDGMSGFPLPLVRILLHRTRDHKLISTVSSDINGRFALQTPLGEEYYVEVKKDGFEMINHNNNFLTGSSLAYDNNYLGGDFRPKEGGSLFEMSLPLMPGRNSLKFVKSALSMEYLIKILRILNIPILLTGFTFSLYTSNISPSYYNHSVVLIYVTVLLSILYRRIRTTRTLGTVTLLETGENVSLAVIRVISESSGKLVKTVITDGKGRYLLALPKGFYRIEITKPDLAPIKDKILLRVNSNLKPNTKNFKMTVKKPSAINLTNEITAANKTNRAFNDAGDIIERFERKREQFGNVNISDAGVHHLINQDYTQNFTDQKPLKIPRDNNTHSGDDKPNWDLPRHPMS